MSLTEARSQRRALGVPGAHGLVSFASNDYLGLSRHPAVLEAAGQALREHGAGAGASRLAGGDHALYAPLEQALARYKGREKACVFGSGWLAAIGALPALCGKADMILADKLSHACLLDAARLSSAAVLRFAHNSVEHARLLLEANRGEYQNCLIVTETVFGMDGDRGRLRELKALAVEFDCWLLTDDAHALGVLPPETSRDADIVLGTLSKAAGSYGGYVCGSAALIDWLATAARSLIFSTGLPPATAAAAHAALNVMNEEPGLLEKPLANARQFTALLVGEPAQSAIVPVILESNERALAASALLESRGFLVAAIRPPTVPENTARLRIAFAARHAPEQIGELAAIIREQGWVC